MTRAFRVLVLGLAVLLGGCFVSTTPLITPEIAVYPIADGTVFEVTGRPFRDEPPAKSVVTMTRDGAFYVHTEVRGEDETIPSRGLMVPLDEGRFIAMAEIEEGFIYALFQADGATYKRFDLMCGALKEAATAAGKTLADFAVSQEKDESDCTFATLDGLKAAVALIVTQATEPDYIYAPKS